MKKRQQPGPRALKHCVKSKKSALIVEKNHSVRVYIVDGIMIQLIYFTE